MQGGWGRAEKERQPGQVAGGGEGGEACTHRAGEAGASHITVHHLRIGRSTLSPHTAFGCVHPRGRGAWSPTHRDIHTIPPPVYSHPRGGVQGHGGRRRWSRAAGSCPRRRWGSGRTGRQPGPAPTKTARAVTNAATLVVKGGRRRWGSGQAGRRPGPAGIYGGGELGQRTGREYVPAPRRRQTAQLQWHMYRMVPV